MKYTETQINSNIKQELHRTGYSISDCCSTGADTFEPKEDRFTVQDEKSFYTAIIR